MTVLEFTVENVVQQDGAHLYIVTNEKLQLKGYNVVLNCSSIAPYILQDGSYETRSILLTKGKTLVGSNANNNTYNLPSFKGLNPSGGKEM